MNQREREKERKSIGFAAQTFAVLPLTLWINCADKWWTLSSSLAASGAAFSFSFSQSWLHCTEAEACRTKQQ